MSIHGYHNRSPHTRSVPGPIKRREKCFSKAAAIGPPADEYAAKLQQILTANDGDKNDGNDLVLVQWPPIDLALLRDATIQFLNAQVSDAKLSEQDRKDYGKILESLRTYVSSNNGYRKVREVPNDLRFQGWTDPDGKNSWDQVLK